MSDSRTDFKEDAQIQEYDDRFYEDIEAPKFVDFTAPDRSLTDEGSWFCDRIGCDQKHEVVDPDAVYRSFLFRVMAARSPNIRLRKALNRQAPSATVKCPHSAPAKSAKDRIPRLAMMASISQKARDNRVKVSLISKLNSTPSNGKVNKSSIEEKALTTPRRKTCPSNPVPFRSVQKTKVTLTTAKTNAAAKALVFLTPKKNEKIASFKCQNIPTPDICSEMKKLAISSPAKVNKLSKNAAHDLHSSLSVKSQLPASNRKNKVSSLSRGFKGREVPSKYLKKLAKTSPKKCNGSIHQGADNDCSDMEIDGKSRNSSMETCPISVGCEGSLEDSNSSKLAVSNTTKETERFRSSLESPSKKKSMSRSGKDGVVSSDDGKSTSIGVSDRTEDKSLLPEDLPIVEKSLPDSKDPQGKNKIIPTLSVILEEGEISQIADVSFEENDQTSNTVRENDEPIEIADKENASASDENRDVNIRDFHCKSKVGCLDHENPLKKVDTNKTTRETAAINGAQVGKYKKAKPTNPKPFRLRTDERGILKEANLERRLQVLSLKDSVPSSKFPNGNLQKRQPAQNEKTNGKCKSNSNSQEISLNELDPPVREVPLKMRPTCCKTTRCSDSKIPRIQKLKEEKEKATKEIQLRREKATKEIQLRRACHNLSPSLQSQLVRPGRSATSPGQLAMTKEAFREDIAENGNTTTTNVGRSSSRGKRPLTVPREPIFHPIHMPKSCIKTSGKVIS